MAAATFAFVLPTAPCSLACRPSHQPARHARATVPLASPMYVNGNGAAALRGQSLCASKGRKAGVAMEVTTNEKSVSELQWPFKRRGLLDKKLRSVSALDAQKLVEEEGYVIVDVRPSKEYDQVHPVGAVNIQLYRAIKEWRPYDIMRRAAYAVFGVLDGTEENPDFVQEFTARFPEKDALIIVACTAGGTLRPTSAYPNGKASRSLNAAYLLLTSTGYTNISHLEGGLQSWFSRRLPVEFEEDEPEN